MNYSIESFRQNGVLDFWLIHSRRAISRKQMNALLTPGLAEQNPNSKTSAKVFLISCMGFLHRCNFDVSEYAYYERLQLVLEWRYLPNICKLHNLTLLFIVSMIRVVWRSDFLIDVFQMAPRGHIQFVSTSPRKMSFRLFRMSTNARLKRVRSVYLCCEKRSWKEAGWSAGCNRLRDSWAFQVLGRETNVRR